MSIDATADLYTEVSRRFSAYFGQKHTVAAYAPGRIEVLGNHTDYNEGFVLSAAINLGTFFLAAPAHTSKCRLVAGDLMEEDSFEVTAVTPARANPWANYVKGVLAGILPRVPAPFGFCGMFLGNIPLGAGLSSSAALEVSSGLALAALYNVHLDPMDMAGIGQSAEHRFVGTKCGLLDQITSLFSTEAHLLAIDFRSLDRENVPIGADALFLMCNTRVKHSLADSEYNERRTSCENAVCCFADHLHRPVRALRDVSWQEWQEYSPRMDPVVAKRAAHVIGENERVRKGRELLRQNKLDAFGSLMFESHESSRVMFENSCPELDFLVSTARHVPGVLGARLSGGGFGGSVVVLVHPRDADVAAHALATAYQRHMGHPCDIRPVVPSGGARRQPL